MWKRCINFEHITPRTVQSNELILHTKGKLCHRVGNEQNRGQADPMPRNNENGRIKTINIPM